MCIRDSLGYTTITAPVDGTVGVRTLRVGEYVQAGTQLMAVAPLQAVYVTANYKETQLTDVRPGQPVTIANPRDAKALGIETIYQTLALADNLDAPANVFLGRELTATGTLDDAAMESATRKVVTRLNPNFKNFKMPVLRLSGGQRQAVAIARAIHFNARALIMDEPTAALGPAETAQVHTLIEQLKREGIGIFLISHDIHDVFDLSDRISVMYHGKLVGTVKKADVTTDEVLGMIILGKPPTKLTAEELAELHG